MDRVTRREEIARNGWRVIWNEFLPAKNNGTPDRRCKPRPNHRMLHIHRNGHKRLYINNVLRAERYAPREL